jgi:hypothetical protein
MFFQKLFLVLVFSIGCLIASAQASVAEGGQFRSVYKQQEKEGKMHSVENSTYGIFKSNSGWKDSKYYVLMNDVMPGTIIKIKSLQTEQVVYAKVLGSLVPAKENEGLKLRLSNAALEALGLKDNSSPLVLTWNN